MPPCLYICCHFEISNEHNGPPSRPKATSKTLQSARRTSRRYSTNRERPRERSQVDRQRHYSHHRSRSLSKARDYHAPTAIRSISQAHPHRALTLQNLVSRDQNTRLHPPHRHTYKPHQQQQGMKENQQNPTTSPRQAKRNYIAKWLQGLISMSTLSSSGSKTKSRSEDESSSVEVVAARDAKGRGKEIRVVSDEVEEGTGVGGEEGGV